MLQARNDTGRPQGGQQAIVGLDKARQTGVAGHICHSRTGRQRSGGPGGSGRSGRGDVIRKVAIILENQGNIKK